jgi:hypothetical protein
MARILLCSTEAVQHVLDLSKCNILLSFNTSTVPKGDRTGSSRS